MVDCSSDSTTCSRSCFFCMFSSQDIHVCTSTDEYRHMNVYINISDMQVEQSGMFKHCVCRTGIYTITCSGSTTATNWTLLFGLTKWGLAHVCSWDVVPRESWFRSFLLLFHRQFASSPCRPLSGRTFTGSSLFGHITLVIVAESGHTSYSADCNCAISKALSAFTGKCSGRVQSPSIELVTSQKAPQCLTRLGIGTLLASHTALFIS
jgi:hypothetical protein